MLYRNILISHCLCLVLSMDKDLVQIIAHIDLCTAAAYLCARCQMALCILCEMLYVYLHLVNQLRYQSVLL